MDIGTILLLCVKGMLGVFAVIALLWLCVALLNCFTRPRTPMLNLLRCHRVTSNLKNLTV